MRVCNSFLIQKSNSKEFANKIVNSKDLNTYFNKNVYNTVTSNNSFNPINSIYNDSTNDDSSTTAVENSNIGFNGKKIGVAEREFKDDLFQDNLEYHKLNDYMGSCFLQYALSIILGRALPDARDGLKVVHRRILWAMHMLKLGPSGQFRKCAKVVGDVLGNYHPHSDKSVYDALCRLSQDFVMKMPLIDGHGNFGSSDDPPAAMRYTECRLTTFSKSLLLDDINLNTVELVPNFDNTHVEPLVLPCRIPNLLINGSSGIAVGLATNIPPHNPTEIIRAAMHLSKNNGVLENEDELLEYVQGPDFPTGGTIKTTAENFKKIYKTGRGTLLLQSKFTFEEKVRKNNRESVKAYNDYNEIKFKIGSRISIVVTEIPYNIKISDVIANINKNVRNNNIVGISDIRDESDRNGTRLVIELKKQISSTIEIAEIIDKLNNLTELSHYFKCNFIALDKNGTKPVRFNLYNALSIWLEFRTSVLKRKFNHLLKQTKYHLNITNGYLIIIRNLQPIIQLIKTYSTQSNMGGESISGNDGDDREIERELYTKLNESYGLNEGQIKYAMKMTLRQLSRLNEEILKLKKEKLEGEIEEYKKLISDDKLIYKEITNDLKQILENAKLNERTTKIEITDSMVGEKSIPMVNTMESNDGDSGYVESTSADTTAVSSTSGTDGGDVSIDASGPNESNITTNNTTNVTDNVVESSPKGSNTSVSRANEDEIDNLVIYNGMGYVGKIKLDNRFYKSNKNKAIKTKLLFTPNTSIINTLPIRGKEKVGKYGDDVVKSDSSIVGTSNISSGSHVTADVGVKHDKKSVSEGKVESVSYCGSNNNNGLIIVTENKIYNISNSKLKLCKKGYNMFKYLQIKPYDQKILYLTNYKPPLKDILILGFDDGMVSIYNNPDVKMKNSAVRLKLKLSNMKDKRIKFFMHANPQDLVDKHLFLCTKMGNCIKVGVKDIVDRLLREKRKRKNVKLVKLKEKDEVSSFCLTGDNRQILILTNLGKCKLINSNDIKLQKTKGKGYKILRPSRANKTSETEKIVNCLSIDSSDAKRNLLLISKSGVLCKKQLNVRPSPKHHKTKKFWSNIPANDELSYSKLL
ncbi:DNA topoisomerase (ATP-hydrolyzing) [Theileria orientalis]|uniref:DNA topoisomerase (ATP-hydrolyzing) n=1 Tax=Theileria orientalis TaxID=68886 RepID=A0A976QSP2_THEOR|nr:DNA topoisomerase (ATP-hydrolyzing) [Theileria orientalis]